MVTYLCCSMHGLQALLEAVTFIYTYADDSIDVNLFAASEADVPLTNGGVRLRQTTVAINSMDSDVPLVVDWSLHG